MVMRRASADTDQIARSLLQKAIRRGYGDVAADTFWYLAKDKDDFKWVRSRLAVFAFEEVWPYGTQISFDKSESDNLRHIKALCSVEKHKDAAGLGSLAYAFSEGDSTVLQDDEDDWYIRVIAKALRDKDKFRKWAQTEAEQLEFNRQRLVLNAIDGSKKAGWPWDKAFTYAAALLAIKKPIPILHEAPLIKADEFPFWVAIDKHTQEGKKAIRKAAEELCIPANTALWLSFYFESAVCQSLAPSPWWDRERLWRLSKLQLSEDQGHRMWLQLRSLVSELLTVQSAELSERVISSGSAQTHTQPAQQSLF